MTGERNIPRWLPRSLRKQLLLGVLTVVTLVLVAVGVVSVLSLRGYVTAMNDAEVAESMHAFSHSFARYQNGDHTSIHAGIPPISQALLEFTGQTPGNLIAVLRDGKVVASAVFSEDEPRPAPPDAIRAIEAQSWTDGQSRIESLGSLGTHQVDSRTSGSDRLVVGVSLSIAEQIIARKQLTTTVLMASALLITAAITAWVVGYALRPLSRVAATAAEVASMPLAGDDHQISVRVRPEDTDPDNEVGIVGHTLNRLLDNVDSALAHRVESDLRMRQFITDASHELRTPLAAIQGYAELTRQDSSNLPPTTEYALARIESEARRMASLVDELLLLSRLGEGEDLQTEDLELADLVSNAVNDAAVAAPTHLAPTAQQSARQRLRAQSPGRHGDHGDHLPSARPRRTVRRVDGRRRRTRYRPRRASAPVRAIRARRQGAIQWIRPRIGSGHREFDRQGAPWFGRR
jgi:two-component system sensor histidine kinase TrcS